MEASDVFAQDIEAGDDPFAEGWDPASEESQTPPVEALPVVDREGNAVEAPAPADGVSAESQEGTEQPVAAEAPAVEPSAEPDPTSAPPTSEATSTGSSGGAVAEDPTPAASTPSAAEAPTAASAEPSGGASATGEPQSDGSEGEDAPEPTEAKGKRRYYILRVDGAGKFTQLSWYEDSKGNMVPKGTTGAKRQAVALARGSEEAMKIGFAAMGAPADGAHLVTVAALHFQPKKVKPLPPEPSKQRLQIG